MSCGHSNTATQVRQTGRLADELQSELDKMSKRISHHEEVLRETEIKAEKLIHGMMVVANVYKDTADEFATAEEAWRRAKNNYKEGGEALRIAAEKYNKAAAAYRRAAITLVLMGIAMARTRGVALCDTMDTRVFRKEMANSGLPVEGKDVDHIVSRALGGKDHPMNYMMLESSLNRRLQEGGMLTKFEQAPMKVLLSLGHAVLSKLLCR